MRAVTLKWSQVRVGDVLEIETKNYGKVRGIVRDVSEPGFPKPIELSTNYGSFVLYQRDLNGARSVKCHRRSSGRPRRR